MIERIDSFCHINPIHISNPTILFVNTLISLHESRLHHGLYLFSANPSTLPKHDACLNTSPLYSMKIVSWKRRQIEKSVEYLSDVFSDQLPSTSTPSACKTHKWKKANESYSYYHSYDTNFEFRYFEHLTFIFVSQLLLLYSAFLFRNQQGIE
jgi:hypothetical protein